MMTMSRAISAGQASNYYKQEFTNSQDNYYREAGEVQGLSRVTRRSHGERILAPRNNAIGQVERIPSLPSYG